MCQQTLVTNMPKNELYKPLEPKIVKTELFGVVPPFNKMMSQKHNVAV
jgi:hypothetical protein